LATSQQAPGSTHEKKLLDESHLSCQESLPIGADRGFQGLEIGKAVVVTPIKRQRKKQGEPRDELTPAQKESNTGLAKARISSEHSHAGLKRNRSVADILRNTRAGMSDQLMRVAMG